VKSFEVTINPVRCTGCGWCVGACPLNLLSLQPHGWRKYSTIDNMAACTGCKKCELRCPFDAIQIARSQPDAIQSVVH